ncbi:MAG: NADH-quinone oxidoreductase subunit C [Chitinispirillaceae bacterium]|jgi:ech hydrogenase subunit D|nr:NADH-quinone oxidoreductase subunit C [Chitinispirillaceae bacterium]
MIEQQPIKVIDRSELAARAAELFKANHRLVQVSCITGETTLEITYSFDKDYAFSNLRITIPRSDAVIPSITGSYLTAFAYENELQDLFGIKVTDLAINYNGKFYKTSIPTPFLTNKAK